MFLGLIRNIQAVGFVKRSLLVWVDIDEAFDTLLACVRPAVTTHPFAFAQGALELAKATFLALVRRQAFTLGTRLQTHIQRQ